MIKKIPHSISLVIPIYNNIKTLKYQIDSCYKILSSFAQKFEIIIIDDGSFDGSKETLQKNFASKKYFHLIFHKQNLGIAPTIYELYKKASYNYIVLYSADGDWNTGDIKKLIMEAKTYSSDIIIGRRNKNAYTVYRRLISFFYNRITSLLFAVNPIDAGSIKMFKKEIFLKTKPASRSLFFEAEMIVKAVNLGYKLTVVPVSYHKAKKSSGTAGKISNVIYSFWDLVKFRLSYV